MSQNSFLQIVRMRGIIFLILLWTLPLIGYVSSQGQIAKINNGVESNALYPTLDFTMILGGNESDMGFAIAVASDGNYYVTGITESSDFPTKNAYDDTYNDHESIHPYGDVFVAKISVNGELLWSTFLGGSIKEEGSGIALDTDGSCYITGWTDSEDFPTKNAFDSSYGGGQYGDAFVAKFASNGELLWCTFLGGSETDEANGIVVSDEVCYVTGSTASSNFPLKNAYNSTFGGGERYGDAFVSKLSATGELLWSTFIGGSEDDYGDDIAIASDGSCNIVGTTESNNFPMKDSFEDSLSGGIDTFVLQFSKRGSLRWSTYLGGDGADFASGIVVDSKNCYIVGSTSSYNFPTKDASNSSFSGWYDAYITAFSLKGLMQWSTYLGGNYWDKGIGIAKALDGGCYITGTVESEDFPTLNTLNNTFAGVSDAFVAKFSSEGFLLWSTYLGGKSFDIGRGIATSNSDSCYVIGETSSSDFPITYTSNSSYIGNGDVFITSFGGLAIITPTVTISGYGYIGFVFLIPLCAFVFRKRRK
ncbi:MAG: SBBP repeat-containing protein [Candidatus Heimdallarchaeota archaeon]|nr:SBBP repeat-containing protein [Candidatus Heimdallarchaeota archaeon]MBY8994628.1 SBBP repeat-containing protein [Candidatus Heimdallarchaeota archaeon]